MTADILLRAIRGADKTAITSARLFDRFEKSGELSLAVEVTLQPQDKSFTDDQIAPTICQTLAALVALYAR